MRKKREGKENEKRTTVKLEECVWEKMCVKTHTGEMSAAPSQHIGPEPERSGKTRTN